MSHVIALSPAAVAAVLHPCNECAGEPNGLEESSKRQLREKSEHEPGKLGQVTCHGPRARGWTNRASNAGWGRQRGRSEPGQFGSGLMDLRSEYAVE